MRHALIGIACISAFGAAGWFALHWLPADSIYDLVAEFSSVPTDDAALATWIQAQPNVYRAFVNRERIGNQWRVEVTFGITHNGWGPAVPNLDLAAANLGYRDPSGKFRDLPR
jgi:hypothetical protein